MKKNYNEISKFLSFILRHQPETIGLKLDKEGWADIQELIDCANGNGAKLDFKTIKHIVETSDKKRFSFSENEQKIRASQGHSTKDVDVSFVEKIPPLYLYHGTASRFMDSISEKGLIPVSRQYVHLSQDEKTAYEVGQRHGKPIVLEVKAQDMVEEGFKFYLSDNGVWLTKNVPVRFIISRNI